MPYTRSQTAARAREFASKNRYVDYGMCLMWSRTMAGIPAKYPNATVAAQNAPLRGGTPPAGSFVYWTGGSQGYGHIAISAGGGYVYTTDYPVRNHVRKARIASVTSAWNLRYRGWSDECNEVTLRPEPRPNPAPSPAPRPYPTPKDRVVYDSKVKPGITNSDSVWWVQYAINKLRFKGQKRLALTGDYGPLTKSMVKLVQAQKFGDKADGDLGPLQIRKLFVFARVNVTHRTEP